MVKEHRCYNYTMVYQPEKGESIYTICRNAYSLAVAKDTGVRMEVLGIKIYVTPESTPLRLAEDWYRSHEGFILGSVGPYPIPITKEEMNLVWNLDKPLIIYTVNLQAVFFVIPISI